MENKEIASVLKLVGQLMELHDENKFKVRSYTNAAFQVSKFPDPLRDMNDDQLAMVPGLGKNLIPKVRELIDTGEMTYLNEWVRQTPPGVIEMLGIKGLGPSKVRTIWEGMEIESPGALLYACYENRLVDLKGFGEKTQEAVIKAIEFMMDNRDRFLYASVEPLIKEIQDNYHKLNQDGWIYLVGAAARKSVILEKLEFLVKPDSIIPESDVYKVPVQFEEVEESELEAKRFERSSAPEHLQLLSDWKGKDEVAIYTSMGLPIIPIEMREGRNELDWARQNDPSQLITDDDLRGCLHNHSTYSDGIHALSDMANHLKEEGYEYFGICDHSQTAVYAGGLKPEDVERQHAEIDKLNDALQPFLIWKGIESDILSDGRLDYEEDILKTFDFVVASIHSGMKMDKEGATRRLIKAIENPYTRILGHPTGRLLLSRPGYPIDHEKVIDACAANGVDIELNANPMRLDIDWTWIPYCMEKGVMIGINPDAHRIEGFEHMRYGVMAARKGGLLKEFCLNALSLEQLRMRWS